MQNRNNHVIILKQCEKIFREENNMDINDNDGDLLPNPEKDWDTVPNLEVDKVLEQFIMSNMVKVPENNFYISKYVVTQNIYKKVVGENPSYFKDESQCGDTWTGLPVETVNFKSAIAFCNKLSEMCDREPCYDENGLFDNSKNGFRLPTGTEWNYVANGGADIPCFKYAGSNNENAVAWYEINSQGKTHKVEDPKAGVKIKDGEIFGLSGNVWEWCWQSDNETKAVCYGGSYNDSRIRLELGTTFNKQTFEKSYKDKTIGFRISVNV